jgi:hypothetical protein
MPAPNCIVGVNPLSQHQPEPEPEPQVEPTSRPHSPPEPERRPEPTIILVNVSTSITMNGAVDFLQWHNGVLSVLPPGAQIIVQGYELIVTSAISLPCLVNSYGDLTVDSQQLLQFRTGVAVTSGVTLACVTIAGIMTKQQRRLLQAAPSDLQNSRLITVSITYEIKVTDSRQAPAVVAEITHLGFVTDLISNINSAGSAIATLTSNDVDIHTSPSFSTKIDFIVSVSADVATTAVSILGSPSIMKSIANSTKLSGTNSVTHVNTTTAMASTPAPAAANVDSDEDMTEFAPFSLTVLVIAAGCGAVCLLFCALACKHYIAHHRQSNKALPPIPDVEDIEPHNQLANYIVDPKTEVEPEKYQTIMQPGSQIDEDVPPALREPEPEPEDADKRVADAARREAERQVAEQQAEAMRQVEVAQQEMEEARKQLKRANSDVERRLAMLAEQEAAKRMEDAARLKEDADKRVADVRREAERQVAVQRAEAMRQVEAAQQEVEEARKQLKRANSDVERRLAMLAEQEAAKRMEDAARLKEDADKRVADVRREAEQQQEQHAAERARWLAELALAREAADAASAAATARAERAAAEPPGWSVDTSTLKALLDERFDPTAAAQEDADGGGGRAMVAHRTMKAEIEHTVRLATNAATESERYFAQASFERQAGQPGIVLRERVGQGHATRGYFGVNSVVYAGEYRL